MTYVTTPDTFKAALSHAPHRRALLTGVRRPKGQGWIVRIQGGTSPIVVVPESLAALAAASQQVTAAELELWLDCAEELAERAAFRDDGPEVSEEF